MKRIQQNQESDIFHNVVQSQVSGVVRKSDEAFADIRSFQMSFKHLSRTTEMIQVMLQLEFNFEGVIDACAMSEEEKKKALAEEWFKSSFVVTDYSNVEEWVAKAIRERDKGKTVVCLVPSRTATNWFHELVLEEATEVRFVKGRVIFAKKEAANSQPDTIVIYCDNPNKVHRERQGAAAVIKCKTNMLGASEFSASLE
jgi:site-specific DNA-methyltransferase (adenine-specific)